MTIETLNHLIGLGTIIAQVATIVLIVLYLIKEQWAENFIGSIALPLSLVITLGATAMTLVYSEYFGVIPCGLCWLQRVALYPQIILFALAWWKKDAQVWLYTIALSMFGAAVSLYQHYLQMGGASAVPCPASGGDCAQRFLFEFGYITFPLASFTLFALLVILMFYYRRRVRSANPS